MPSVSTKVMMDAQAPQLSKRKRGFLNPRRVARFTFCTMTVCILVAVFACILAIWKFTGTDVLWRTIATSVVIAGGTMAFSWVNGLFDASDD